MRPRSRLSDSVWTAFTEAIRFVVVPLVLVDLIRTNYSELSTAFMPNIAEYILFFGGMIVAASTLESANKPGTFKRLLFGLSALAFVCMWIFVILGGGVATFGFGPYFVRFDMSKIVFIMLFGISLKGLLVISTYTTHKRYLDEKERRDRLEATIERDRERELARKKTIAKQRATGPSFSSMSKVSFQVTSDDSVGYSPPAPSRPGTHPQRTLAYRTCAVCGAKAGPKDKICSNCGAWFEQGLLR